MLTIRFFRTGKKNQPFFKIVVIDKRKAPKSGRFVEEVGFYNPLTKEKNIKADRVKYWISVGAAPSDTLHNLLVKEQIIDGKKVDVHKEKEEEKPTETTSQQPVIEKKEEVVSEEPVIDEKPEEKVQEKETVKEIVSEEPVVEKKEEVVSEEPVIDEKPEEKVQEKETVEEDVSEESKET